MSVTSIKVSTEIRDRLAAIASMDFSGSTLSEAVGRLIDEHAEARTRIEIMDSYRRLQSDPHAWATYLAEMDEWDPVTGDGLTGQAA